MSKHKSLIAKCRIKSLYVKWILIFIVLIFLAQAITLIFATKMIIPEVTNNLSEKLYRKARFVQSLHAQGIEITDQTMDDIGDTDIKLRYLETGSSEELGKYKDIISLDMITRAQKGEIVSSNSTEMLHRMPFCLLLVEGKLVLLTPDLQGNELTVFIAGMAQSMIMSILLASVFITCALVVIIHTIRRVTNATREVAKGNYNVALKYNSPDEVGELVENFNLMTAELRKNEYLKKDFVSSVSHEFKTPITSIEGFAKLLKNKDLPREEFDDYTDIIIKETVRLSNLSTNLLKLSVLDSSEFEPEKTKYYIDEQIRNVILLLERQWEEKNIFFDIEMQEVLFNGNEELLSQVWINLIQNAIKFSPMGGTIGIHLQQKNYVVQVEISDQGGGISAQHAEKIFTRFYKADKGRSKEGNGLGLPIAKRIVEISKGNIGFESQKGNGTRFFVNLPNK